MDRKTTQAIEEETKTVRVGYFPYANFQEGGSGEHKQGAGYEYLQKIYQDIWDIGSSRPFFTE
ncbi:hypothetical protein [uncultured Eubacterium sp.]|uniref:hypothetical protein n=1 Tax=uncultured Eubacterium sp. TaxID=165185 RepID=UPI0025D9FCED|nr:hypothetical protein [uncultured Eubacterium sp.]